MRKKDRLYTANKWNQPLFNRYNWGGLAIADKVANPWNYADDVDVTKQYMNSKNAFGISKADNPFSKGNLQAAFSKQGLGNALKGVSSGLITAGSGLVGGLLGDSLSGGLSSNAGKAIDTIGTTIGGTLSSVSPALGGATIIATKGIKGITDMLLGSKLNQENINKVKQKNEGLANTTNALGQTSDAGSYISALTGTDFSSDFSDSYIGEDGIWGHKAADTAAELRAQREQNLIALNDAATYNANRLNDASEARAFRNYIGAAYGGKLNKRKKNDNMDLKKLYTFGGNLFYGGGPEELLSNVDTRSDTTRQGYYEGTIPYNAGASVGTFPLTDVYNAIEDFSSTIKDNPFVLTGVAPTPAKAAMKEGLARSAREASKLSGKTFTPTMRNAQGKRSSNFGAINANDVFNENKIITGQGVKKTVEPFKFQGYSVKDATEAANTYIKKNKLSTFMGPNGKMYVKMADGKVRTVEALGRDYIQQRGFAFGGNLQTHGSDWPTGLTHIDAGGSHESNPNEGVQMGVDPEGTPNLVEEGEVVFNDYVYSNRIKLDAEAKKAFRFGKKQDITYAEAAKKLEKEISERPNDPISKAGFKAQMEELAQHQERQKQEMEAERAKEAFEALSPEEQVAIMQQAQQQEQMTQEEALQQQAMQEQAMAEEQGMQQLSPEEAAMMQEQQMAQQAPSEEELFAAQAANVAANGGLLVKATDVEPNKFAYSGRMRRRAIKKYNNDWFLTQARSLGLLGDNDDVISVTDGDGKVHKFEYNPKDPELNLSTFNNIYREYQKKKALDTYIKGKRQAKRNELFGDKGLYSFSDNKEKIYKNRVGEKDRVGYINSSYTGDLVNDTYDGFISTEEYNKLVDKYNKLKDDKNAKSADVENLRNKLAGYKPINEKAGDFMYDYNGKIIRDLQDGVTEDSILDAYNEDYKKGFEWDGKNAAALNYPAELTHSGTSYLRYAPALGGMIGLINDVTSNPDYNRAQSIINGSKINTPYISAPVLGDYMTYRPMDIWSKQYALDANARATDRSITNNAAPIGTKIAGKLANNYNNQIASGNLYRNALEYNDALLEKVKNFNRTTNQINAAMNMSAQEANQRAFMHNNEQAFKGLLYGNQMMEDIDNRRNASMNANLTNLLTSIGNIGEEAYDEDRLKWLENTGVLKSNVFSAAEGGKLKRKKNKRGLTF